MGFLKFLKGGGGNIISSVLGGGMGLIGGAINAKAQKEMQEASFKYGREMMEKQNQAELQRMGLQFDYNKQTAQYHSYNKSYPQVRKLSTDLSTGLSTGNTYQ